MKEYHKINSIYKRSQDKIRSLVPGDYSQEEFGAIRRWCVEEKVDGTNIRIHYVKTKDGASRIFGGRTEEAQIPAHLFKYLEETFTLDKLSHTFNNEEVDIVLYGEGIGPKINGNIYELKECKFVLFDVRVGHWWLKREDVYGIAKDLGVMQPTRLAFTTEEEVVTFLNRGDNHEWPNTRLFDEAVALTPDSFTMEDGIIASMKDPKTGEEVLCPQFLVFKNLVEIKDGKIDGKISKSTPMEGVVARADPELLDRAGHRIIWKLKCKDLKDWPVKDKS